MSHISEHDSKDNKSSQDTEYHSESGSELEKEQNILVNPDEGFTYLHIQFPLPYNFPKPYLNLQEVVPYSDALPKASVQNTNIAEDPDSALCYIITHFSSNEVSQSIREFPRLELEHLYYLTYIDTSWYTKLQHLIMITGKNLWTQNALAQEQLDLHG